MQLSLTYKSCSCEKCDFVKNCLTPNAKSINDKSSQHTGQPVRHRTFSRARQPRPRARHSYGNQQHRLDHTYAAAEVTSGPVEAPATTMSNGNPQQQQQLQQHQQQQQHQHQHQQQQQQQQQLLSAERLLKANGILGFSGTWSPKAVDPECRQRPRGKVTYDEKSKENQPPLNPTKGRLKQYQKHRAVNNKIEKTTTTATVSGKGSMVSVNEERRRWIAATAMLELSRGPVIHN